MHLNAILLRSIAAAEANVGGGDGDRREWKDAPAMTESLLGGARERKRIILTTEQWIESGTFRMYGCGEGFGGLSWPSYCFCLFELVSVVCWVV